MPRRRNQNTAGLRLCAAGLRLNASQFALVSGRIDETAKRLCLTEARTAALQVGILTEYYSPGRPAPDRPTPARPGCTAKVTELSRRAKAGVGLWNPFDARLPAESGPPECRPPGAEFVLVVRLAAGDRDGAVAEAKGLLGHKSRHKPLPDGASVEAV